MKESSKLVRELETFENIVKNPEKLGFTNIASCPALGLKLELPKNRYFKEEFVEDVAQRINDFSKNIGTNYRIKPTQGYCNYIKIVGPDAKELTYNVIPSTITPEFKQVTSAHEFGHTLHNFNMKDEILKDFNSNREFRRFAKDTERFACLCGSYAFFKMGFNLNNNLYKSENKKIKAMADKSKEMVMKYLK